MPMSSVVSLTSLLQKLPLNKVPGPDFISAEHLLHADESVFFLNILFTLCIVHRFVPNSCLKTIIVPICKNKNGYKTDTSNYRLVAVATSFLFRDISASLLLSHFGH